MINPKVIVGSAIGGFVLSFLTGLFSGAGFLIILFRAVMCAAGFGGISAAVQYVSAKFLTPDTLFRGMDRSTDSVVRPGSNVDITIADEELPKDENGPQFFVNTNNQGETDSGIEKQTDNDTSVNPVEKVALDESGFIPVALGKNDGLNKNIEADVRPDTEEENVPSSVDNNNDVEKLDELPDLGDLVVDGSDKENLESGVIQDSDFASQDTALTDTPARPAGRAANMKDTALLTQAVRTVLANDQ
jgi:hypothetical protein